MSAQAQGRCPAGHESTELDYCSVCGSVMGKAPQQARSPASSAASSPASSAAVCPECTEPRADPDARFCEVCRYDFVGRSPGRPPAVRTTPAAASTAASTPATPAGLPAVAPTVTATTNAPLGAGASPFLLLVQTDASLDSEPDPAQPCPRGTPDVEVRLDRPEILVGRRDDLRDVHPEIPLNDPGTSRRHCKFLLGADGSVALQDLASTNGTKLNGVEVAAGSRTPVRDGDTVTLGRWTRIVLQARR